MLETLKIRHYGPIFNVSETGLYCLIRNKLSGIGAGFKKDWCKGVEMRELNNTERLT